MDEFRPLDWVRIKRRDRTVILPKPYVPSVRKDLSTLQKWGVDLFYQKWYYDPKLDGNMESNEQI